MSCCQQCGDPHPCRCSDHFTDPTSPAYHESRTLAGSLIPAVDCIRDIYTCLGTRSYDVLLVRTRWSGGERGVGVEEVIHEHQILPVPRVKIRGVKRPVEGVGILEAGEITVDQVSARFTEDQLLGIPQGGRQIPDDQQFYWEIRAIDVGFGLEQRRRFFPSGVPDLDMMNLMWTVNLVRVGGDRGRSGDVR